MLAAAHRALQLLLGLFLPAIDRSGLVLSHSFISRLMEGTLGAALILHRSLVKTSKQANTDAPDELLKPNADSSFFFFQIPVRCMWYILSFLLINVSSDLSIGMISPTRFLVMNHAL